MPDNDTDFSPGMLRAVELEHQFALQLRDLAMSEVASTSRWLLASLVAVNGGAAIAIMDTDIAASVKLGSVGCFVAGIVFALLNGLLGSFINRKALPLTTALAAYWLTVADDHQRDEEIEAGLKKKGAAIQRAASLATVPGYISAGLFVAGFIVVATAIT